MRSKSGLVLALCLAGLAACSPAPGQTEAVKAPSGPPVFKLVVGQEIACRDDEFLQERLALQIGYLSQSRSAEVERKALDCMAGLWGTADRESLTLALLAVLKVDPDAFLDVMSEHPDVIDAWAGLLAPVAYAWSDPLPCGHDAEIRRIRAMLAQTTDSPKVARVRAKVISAFATLQCHVID